MYQHCKYVRIYCRILPKLLNDDVYEKGLLESSRRLIRGTNTTFARCG
jgi:hypothetical protein